MFTLAIYNPLAYYKGDDKSIDPFDENRQKQVVGLIRTGFLKRFESSVAAFELSCDRLMRKLLAFLVVRDQRGATVEMMDELEDRRFPLLRRRMCCEQPPDAEMRRGASVLRDQGIGGFLDPVVDKPVGALQPFDHLVTDRLPQLRVDLLLRGLVHESQRCDRGAVSQARQLLEGLLGVDR